jgi:hypothetical protein
LFFIERKRKSDLKRKAKQVIGARNAKRTLNIDPVA